MPSLLTRRAALVGAAASTAALAVPFSALAGRLDHQRGPDAAEHLMVKARRLARELSATLEELRRADFAGADVVAIVYPAGASACPTAFADREFYNSRNRPSFGPIPASATVQP